MNTGFQELDILVRTGNGRHMILMEPFTYVTISGVVITVPMYAESDGASTPQIMWNLLPPFGRYWKAAFLHDYLYRHTQYPKDFCDDVFYEAMGFLGVDDEVRGAIYQGVHLGGWRSFEDDRAGVVRSLPEDDFASIKPMLMLLKAQ